MNTLAREAFLNVFESLSCLFLYRIAHLLHSSYIRPMKTLTVRLPDAMAKQVEEQSLARRVSKSNIVRERLDQPALPTPKEAGLREILKAAWSAKLSARRGGFARPINKD